MTKQKSNKEIIRKILGKYLKANMMEYIHAIDKDKPVSSCISTKEDYDKLVSELSQLIPEEGEVIAEANSKVGHNSIVIYAFDYVGTMRILANFKINKEIQIIIREVKD